MSPSASLSVAVFASRSLIPSIREGIESLGHAVVLAEDPATLSESTELLPVDLVFVALDPDTEEALDCLEKTLDVAPATLFDEAENKHSWTPARWGQHLHPKLLKVGRRQEPEKLPLSSASLAPILTDEVVGEDIEPHAMAWDLIEESSEIHSLEEPAPPSEVVAAAPAPVFDGGFDFYDDEPSMLGAVDQDRHQEVPEPVQPSPRQEALQGGSQDLKREQSTSPAGLDFSALSLLSDEDVLPASPKNITATRPLLEVPQWSLDGEEPSAQPEDASAAPELEPFPVPLDHTPETAENPGATPIFQETQGLVLIGGGTGGPGALVQLMEHLPSGLPVPVAVAQPLPQGRHEVFAGNLQKRTAIPVELGTLGQVLTPGRITLLPEGATVVLGDQGWQIEAGNPADAIATLGEDSALMLLSGTPGIWVIPAMEAVGMGALLLGQDPSQALESHTISTLIEIGLTSGTPAELGEHLAHRWGLALA